MSEARDMLEAVKDALREEVELSRTGDMYIETVADAQEFVRHLLYLATGGQEGRKLTIIKEDDEEAPKPSQPSVWPDRAATDCVFVLIHETSIDGIFSSKEKAVDYYLNANQGWGDPEELKDKLLNGSDYPILEEVKLDQKWGPYGFDR